MNFYQTKANLIPGSNYKEVKKNVDQSFSYFTKKTKRQPYVRSAYFLKQKVFFNIFWSHLLGKAYGFRAERLRYFEAAIDLMIHSRNHPTTTENPNNLAELLHRFYGITKEKNRFVVQIKEIKRNGKLYLMSMFPV